MEKETTKESPEGGGNNNKTGGNENKVRVMTNLKETGERTTTKEGRMTTEEEMIGDEMTGGLGRTINVEEMTSAEEGMTEGLESMIEKIEETGTAAKRLHTE